MEIEIKNCNNVDFASISLEEGMLNIKYAPNGSGKSTIAKAILLQVTGAHERLGELTPFKYLQENPDNKQPEVAGTESLKSVMCFNEDYIDLFVYKKDELLVNSFDILIRTDAYRQIEIEIEELISDIKNMFSDNSELEGLIATLTAMGNAFKLSKLGISRASTGMKGLASGNKLHHIPAGLESYKPFIQCDESVSWIEWQTKGCTFAELSDNCPFCTSDAADKKEQIKQVGQEYDKNTIRNLIAIIDLINKLGDFFSPNAKKKLGVITTLKDGLSKEHEAFLAAVKTQIDNFIEKLEKLKALSGFQFKDDEKVSKKLADYRLNFDFYPDLQSIRMQEEIEPINDSIDRVIEKASKLQGRIGIQRKIMRDTIVAHQNDINGFLETAGYRYKVIISGEDEKAQLKLQHVEHLGHLAGGDQHLSFGERNAFAIVLFMYECLSKKPDLIILDDPISSFDCNKKYAILEMLFRRETEKCLKMKTVLMLTHDIEPIIDTTKSLAHKFGNQTTAAFLKLQSGQISECKIARDDLKTFSQIFDGVLESEKDDILKLIYIRRHLEIINDMGDAYQVISNVLHCRERAIDSREAKIGIDYPEMERTKFCTGCTEIAQYLASFSYPIVVSRIKDTNAMKALYASCVSGYEKLQIFRLLNIEMENKVVQKFVNETYHIENDFICQLDPSMFDTIPEYIVSACSRALSQMS